MTEEEYWATEMRDSDLDGTQYRHGGDALASATAGQIR